MPYDWTEVFEGEPLPIGDAALWNLLGAAADERVAVDYAIAGASPPSVAAWAAPGKRLLEAASQAPSLGGILLAAEWLVDGDLVGLRVDDVRVVPNHDPDNNAVPYSPLYCPPNKAEQVLGRRHWPRSVLRQHNPPAAWASNARKPIHDRVVAIANANPPSTGDRSYNLAASRVEEWDGSAWQPIDDPDARPDRIDEPLPIADAGDHNDVRPGDLALREMYLDPRALFSATVHRKGTVGRHVTAFGSSGQITANDTSGRDVQQEAADAFNANIETFDGYAGGDYDADNPPPFLGGDTSLPVDVNLSAQRTYSHVGNIIAAAAGTLRMDLIGLAHCTWQYWGYSSDFGDNPHPGGGPDGWYETIEAGPTLPFAATSTLFLGASAIRIAGTIGTTTHDEAFDSQGAVGVVAPDADGTPILATFGSTAASTGSPVFAGAGLATLPPTEAPEGAANFAGRRGFSDVEFVLLYDFTGGFAHVEEGGLGGGGTQGGV